MHASGKQLEKVIISIAESLGMLRSAQAMCKASNVFNASIRGTRKPWPLFAMQPIPLCVAVETSAHTQWY